MVSRPAWWPALVTVGSMAAIGIAAHTAANLRNLRSPRPGNAVRPAPIGRISVLVPARNEESTIGAAIPSILAQASGHAPGDASADDDAIPLEVIVLDDGSDDATGEIVTDLAGRDARLRVLSEPDDDPPPGWLGKPWACHRLSEAATGDVLVFMDADVVLAPGALGALVDELRGSGLSMIAPYPAQEAGSWLERLVQPLVTWSWAATMPLRWAEQSLRPSLAAANGQLIAVDALAYRSAGGHAAVRSEVLEDIALMRAFKRAGFHTATVDGSRLASCRMYDSPAAVIDGYGKSLWDAFNGPLGSVAVNGLLITAFVVPALGTLTTRGRTRAIGALGYAAGVSSRALVARRVGDRILPDTLAQPASILAFAALNVVSWKRHLRGQNRWKGRAVVPHDPTRHDPTRHDPTRRDPSRHDEGRP